MRLELILRFVWLTFILATLWFALVPAQMGGLGGAGYHGVAFMVLGLLTPAAFPRVHLLLVWLGLVVLGGGIELAQELTDFSRHGEWADFRLNVIAASVGVIYAWIGRYLLGRIRAEDAEKSVDAGTE